MDLGKSRQQVFHVAEGLDDDDDGESIVAIWNDIGHQVGGTRELQSQSKNGTKEDLEGQ